MQAWQAAGYARSKAVQFYLTLHMNKPLFNDPRVRRAVFLAIDRQELVKIVRCAEPYDCFGSVGTFLPNKGGQVVESPYANGVKATLNLASSTCGSG